VAVQMYTSGTTGRAKGAMLTHRNLCLMVLAWSVEMPLRGGETRFLQVTPLFHVGGLMMVLLNVAHGSTLLLEPEFQPAAAVRRLQRERATHALLVPAMIRWMLLDPAMRGASFPDLDLVLYGAAPCPAEHLVQAMEAFGCGFLHAYGLTETAGVVTALRPKEHLRALAEEPALLESAGRAMIGCEVRILDRAGQPLPDGELGEIVVRGPNVFVGYWHRPEETAEALRDGWLWTGDVGRMDARGYLTIVDRSKDMIIVGGENVYPSEVEAVVRQVPGVRDVAVIGIPHAVWGEAVLALVVADDELEDGDGLPGRVVQFARERLARFKCPSGVERVAELPRTPAGKVQKAVLRAPYWSGRSRTI
jgi:long-chain acyl-CoA synthetase